MWQNRWRDAARPLPPGWVPTRTVTVVIPAYNAAETLDLTLASLAAQDYPSDLLEVIVVDDGSASPYELPDLRPTHTVIMRPTSGWGRANACDTGARAGTGELILWLDADIVAPRDHVRAHVALHEQVADVATKGDLLFVPTWELTPEAVYRATAEDDLTGLFGAREHLERQWTEDVYARTDDLNDAGPYWFSILTGASAMVSREMYVESGGLDTRLRLGEDSEFAHRLAQLGAVFAPVRSAAAYHLGATNTQLRNHAVKHYDSPHFARRSPQISGRRTSLGRQWEVPKILAVVETDVASAKYARAAVDRLLTSTEEDLAVVLVGPWSALHDERRRVLEDPTTELYLVREWYAGEGRVVLTEDRPRTGFPSPYLLEVPVTVGADELFVESLLRSLVKDQRGLASVPFVGRDGQETVRLFRTAAHSRALRHLEAGETIEHAIDRVWGSWVHDPARFELVDLTGDVDLGAPVGRKRSSRLDDARVNRLRRAAHKARRERRRLEKRIGTLERQLRELRRPRLSVRQALRALARDARALGRALLRR